MKCYYEKLKFWPLNVRRVVKGVLFTHCFKHLSLATALILMLVINPACQRPQICKRSSIMAPPSCPCPGLPSLLWPLTSPSPTTQVQRSSQDALVSRCQIRHWLFTSDRKPDHSCLCYIGQPPWLLGLLHHVTAVLIPQPVLDVLPAWARRSSTAVERHTGGKHAF